MLDGGLETWCHLRSTGVSATLVRPRPALEGLMSPVKVRWRVPTMLARPQPALVRLMPLMALASLPALTVAA